MMDRDSYGFHDAVVECSANCCARWNDEKVGRVPGAVDEALEESERAWNLFEGPALIFGFGARAGAAGLVGRDAGGDVGEAGVVAAEEGELLVEIAAVVFAVFGDEFVERGLFAHGFFL